MGKNESAAGNVKIVRVRQESRAATGGKCFAEQEITVAVHDEYGNADIAQAAKCGDHLEVEIVAGVVNAVVAGPSFEQIAKNIELVGKSGLVLKIVKKTPGDARRC